MNKRDLKADLELCNKATPGPWRAGESFVITFHDEWICEVVGEYSMDCEDNMRFVAQAREGWPHAIERALEAEDLCRELVEALEVAFELLEDHQPNWYLRMHFNQINNALGSCKEVLGDE